MVLKGLPEDYKQFTVITTQSEKVLTFDDFKVSLRSFEENEKASNSGSNDNVMHINDNMNCRLFVNKSSGKITCYECGVVNPVKKRWCISIVKLLLITLRNVGQLKKLKVQNMV